MKVNEYDAGRNFVFSKGAKDYKAYTNFAFCLAEANLFCKLFLQGLSLDLIKKEVLYNDIFQMRSHVSRVGLLRAFRELLENVPHPYIEFLAYGTNESQRFTLLFLSLRVNRFLREVVSELLIEKIQSFTYLLDKKDLYSYFNRKYEQELILSQWSDSTYRKACSNSVLILVRSGLLRSVLSSKAYEIQPMPLPPKLKEQLLQDQLEIYVKLMLN